MNLNLAELTRELQEGRIHLEPSLRSTHMYFRDPEGRLYTHVRGNKVLAGSVNKTAARELGLQELWYDEDGLRLIFPIGYSFDEAGLVKIREAIEFNSPNSVSKMWFRRYVGEGQMPRNKENYERPIDEGFARWNDEKNIFEIESEVPPENRGSIHGFWLPIGICGVKSIPEGFNLWGTNIRYHDMIGQHYVTGRVTAYPARRDGQPEVIGISIQREPVVKGIPFDSGYYRGESSVLHSHMPEHDHESEVSGINDTTTALAQWIIDEAVLPKPL